MHNCLIVDKLHDSIFQLMENIGVQVDYQPEITRAEILAIIPKYTGIIIRSKTTIDQEFLEHAQLLEWVGRAGAGLDQLDVEALEKRKIQIVNAPDGNCDALAEHTLGLMLSVLNKIGLGDQQIRQGVWDREANRGYELGVMTVGIIGYGFMGKAVCKRLKSFGCRVIGYDKYLKNYTDEYIKEESLETLLGESDLISLHIPLTDETMGMVDRPFIDNCGRPFFLINTARGEIVNLNALNEGLSSGKVLGAGLDVLENEKISTWNEEEIKTMNLLQSFSQVIMTPHVGGWTFESYQKINRVLTDKIAHVIKN